MEGGNGATNGSEITLSSLGEPVAGSVTAFAALTPLPPFIYHLTIP